MKKKIISLAMIFSVLLMITGCTSNKAYTFTVETGDKIKVELDTTDGYDLSSDLPFTISKDGNTLSQGTFITSSAYNKYVNSAKTDSLAKVIDEGSKDNIDYVFYSYNNSEYNYVIKVKNSNTGILLGNPNSKEEAKTCFDLLTFSLEQ